MFRSHRYCFWLTIICCDMPFDSWLAITSSNTMSLKKTACDDSLVLELVFQPFHSPPPPLSFPPSASCIPLFCFQGTSTSALSALSLSQQSCARLTNPFNLDFNYHVSFVIRLCPPGIKPCLLSLFLSSPLQSDWIWWIAAVITEVIEYADRWWLAVYLFIVH